MCQQSSESWQHNSTAEMHKLEQLHHCRAEVWPHYWMPVHLAVSMKFSPAFGRYSESGTIDHSAAHLQAVQAKTLLPMPLSHLSCRVQQH